MESIYYAEYESREDAITYEDAVDGLQEELRRRGLVDHGSFDVVVHSTGGLVIRHWIWRHYGHRIDDCPVENLVMLVPANFGSPLAHRDLLGPKPFYDTDHIRDVVIHDPAGESDAPSSFYPNTTTLAELQVDRVTDYVTVGTEPREH